MTTNPRPILCDTDSEIQNTTDTNAEHFFKHNELFESIPDFTDSNDNTNISKSNSTKLNVTKLNNSDKQTIDEMIYHFHPENDNENENNDLDNTIDFSTKNKFSSLIGEMRVDILSLVNLIGVLNKNVTSNNEEIQNLKKEINRLVAENVFVKEKMIRLKDDQINMRDNNDSKFDTLILSLEKKQSIVDHSTNNQSTNNQSSNKIVKKNDIDNQENEKNVFNDALMEKRANKFKVVPTRTRVGNDMFGTKVETKEEPPLSNTTRQIMRKENIDNALKKTKDTSQIRGARMGLLDTSHSDSDQTLTVSSSAPKNAKPNPKPNTNRVSTRRK